MPRACVGGQSPRWGGGGGVVRGLLASGTVFESIRACFCEFGQTYILRYQFPQSTVTTASLNLKYGHMTGK